LIRSSQTGFVDLFLVSAALTVLTLRVYLAAANYPQLGGNGLHIAHVLWGGLGMVIAIGVLLSFLSRNARLIAALIGGVGFGAFVDELGKFLTSDNNYFFKPTAALIYTIFVIGFLVARRLARSRTLSPQEHLVNAIELAKEHARGRTSQSDRERVLMLLDHADQANPLVPALRDSFVAMETEPVEVGPTVRFARRAERWYALVVGNRWFRRIVAGVFVLQALGTVFVVFGAVLVAAAAVLGNAAARASIGSSGTTGLTAWIVAVATVLAGAFTVVGVVALRRSRLRAYRAFELSVLVDLLLAQPFSLLTSGFAGLADVALDLVLLALLTYMQMQERHLHGWGLASNQPPDRKERQPQKLVAGWVLAAAFGGLLISLATPVVVITAYALGMGLMTSSAPDQSAVDAVWSSKLGWLLLIGTTIGAALGATVASRTAGSRGMTGALLVGAIFSAALLLSIPLTPGAAGDVLVRVGAVVIISVVVGLTAKRKGVPNERSELPESGQHSA
jgi:hypothetical protein